LFDGGFDPILGFFAHELFDFVQALEFLELVVSAAVLEVEGVGVDYLSIHLDGHRIVALGTAVLTGQGGHHVLEPAGVAFEVSRFVVGYFHGEFGAGSRDRTDDILITNQVLYQLSYTGVCKLERVKGIEPSYATWKDAVLPLNYTRMVF
jgi:hypothetical protein